MRPEPGRVHLAHTKKKSWDHTVAGLLYENRELFFMPDIPSPGRRPAIPGVAPADTRYRTVSARLSRHTERGWVVHGPDGGG